uniref:Uncharacterized protein n=1 Tax=Xanthomonas euvesicatoria TaxID=456327 RepID=Q5QA91_XANEU|nr:hypothetical protein [Xanthomonas euvesicatoria]
MPAVCPADFLSPYANQIRFRSGAWYAMDVERDRGQSFQMHWRSAVGRSLSRQQPSKDARPGRAGRRGCMPMVLRVRTAAPDGAPGDGHWRRVWPEVPKNLWPPQP